MTMAAKTGADGARGNSAEEIVLLTQLLSTKKKADHDRLWAAFVHRYERLIVSCVVKALRRYGATFSRDELSPEELARSLGVTTNTVYSRKFKIREKLQKIVRTLDGATVAA